MTVTMRMIISPSERIAKDCFHKARTTALYAPYITERSERSEKNYLDTLSSLTRAVFGASDIFFCTDTKCLRATSHALTRVSARSAGFSLARNSFRAGRAVDAPPSAA